MTDQVSESFLLLPLNPSRFFMGENSSTLTLTSILIALLLLQRIVLFIRKRLWDHKTFERMNINGPKPNFFHGHLYDTRRIPYVNYVDNLHKKYGKTFGIYLGAEPFLVTKDLELTQQVFVANSRTFYDRMNFYLNIDPVPHNLICQRGDRWRYMRKLLTPAFTNSKIKSNRFYHDTQKTAENFILQLETNSQLVDENNFSSASQDEGKKTKRERVTFVEDVYDRMAAVALDVIVKTAFHMEDVISFKGPLMSRGVDKKKSLDRGEEGTKDVFLDTVKRASRLGLNPLVELIFCFPALDGILTFLGNHLYFSSILTLLMKRLDYLVRRTEPSTVRNGGEANRLEGFINIGRKPQNSTENTLTHTKQRRIIDSLIEVLREGKITKSEFKGNAFVIVFAGFETTANALTFTLWLMAKHPQVQEKLRQQLLQQMSKLSANGSTQEGISLGKMRKLSDNELAELAFGCEYLEMVLNESLRLYPPVPGLSCRKASVESTLANGMRIEKGVTVIPSVFSIHRDKSIWGEDAHLFKPERFEMLSVNQLNSAMFMPFGLGPRNCIGKAAAIHEMKIVIGRLILDYYVQLWPGKTPERLKLCSPINITITNSEKIGLKFVKIQES